MAKKTRKKSKTKKKPKVKPLTTHHTIGVLHSGTKNVFKDLVELMREKAEDDVKSRGGPNDTVSIFDNGHYANDVMEDLEKHAADLVKSSVPVIVAAGGPQSALAAMDATIEADWPRNETPVVFTTVADPVGLGLVDTLDKPGGNLTGMAGRTSENDPERLRILHALVSLSRPGEKRVGVIINRRRQGYQKQYRALKKEADGLGLKLKVKRATDLTGVGKAFQKFRSEKFLGVVVTADAFFNNNRVAIIKEAKDEDGIPTIYQWREFVDEGGLISYGPSIEQAYEKAGEFVAVILLKEKAPKDMECSKPGAFKIFVKQSTATSLGLVIPVPNILDGKPFTVIP